MLQNATLRFQSIEEVIIKGAWKVLGRFDVSWVQSISLGVTYMLTKIGERQSILKHEKLTKKYRRKPKQNKIEGW